MRNPRFRGLVDLDRFSRQWDAATQSLRPGATVIRVDGLDLSWDPRHVAVALEGDVLALVCGGDLRDSARASQWIARYRSQSELASRDFDGGFASLIVDRAAARAVLSVDRFAIQSACYRVDGTTLGISDSCREVPGASLELDPQAVYDYLYFHVVPAPFTIFRSVRRVENAQCVVFDRGGVRSRPYWVPEFEEDNRADLGGRMQRFVEEVRSAVAEEASGEATACFLSGGTDSSTIAGMLARIQRDAAPAYSIGFESEGYDEMHYARIAARHFGLAHREYYVTPDDVADAIPAVAASYDQPFGNSSVLPAYYCALRAREDGFAKMLAGDGGDELYGGNSRYATQKLFDLYQRLPEGIRRNVLEPPALHWQAMRAVPGLRQIGGYVRHSRLAMPDRMSSFNLLDRLGPETVLTQALLTGVDTGHPIHRQREVWNSLDATSLVNRMLAFDWKFTLADTDLPKVGGATRLAGVEVGYPLLRRRIVDFSLTLPPDWKVRNVTLRWFFKRALKDFLPPAILRKKKHGFGLPFGPWCLRHPRLRSLAEDSLASIAAKGIVRPEFTCDLLEKRLPEAPGYYGEMIFILVMLDQWMRRANV